MMSPKSTTCDSTNKPKISVKKSSTDVGALTLAIPHYDKEIIVAMDAFEIC